MKIYFLILLIFSAIVFLLCYIDKKREKILRESKRAQADMKFKEYLNLRKASRSTNSTGAK